MDWRQLHWGWHLLGPWGSAHQDEGISATGVGCFRLQFPLERAGGCGVGACAWRGLCASGSPLGLFLLLSLRRMGV